MRCTTELWKIDIVDRELNNLGTPKLALTISLSLAALLTDVTLLDLFEVWYSARRFLLEMLVQGTKSEVQNSARRASPLTVVKEVSE